MLGEDIEIGIIERELKLFLDYGVSPQEAKRGVIKKLGKVQSMNLSSVAIDKNLIELVDSDNNVNLKVKIISVDKKTVTVDGEDKQIYYGILADETASLPYTSWNDFGLEKDAVINVNGAYVKSFRGELQVNFGNNTNVEQLHSEELAGLTPERLAEYMKSKEMKIEALRSGISNVTVIGRVLDVGAREVTARGERKIVYSGSLGDDTGKVQFSAWHDFNLKPGNVIRIEGCYVKAWRGIPQLSFDENSSVEMMDDSLLPAGDIIQAGPIRELIDLEEVGGAFDVTVEGTVLEVRSGSGLVKRCPECRRVLQNDECMVHGSQPGGTIELRVKAIIDDGTGSLMVVIGDELTESILNVTKEDYTESAGEPGYIESIIEQLNEKMLIRRFRFRGNVTQDNFGLMMIARDVELLEQDFGQGAEDLLEKMGGL